MNSSCFFLVLTASLLCCLNSSYSQTTTRVFDEKKFLGNLHMPERINHYTKPFHQLVRKDDNQHDYSFITDQPINYRDQSSVSSHHDQRNSFPYRRTSSSTWFQQHPVASPIRSPSHEIFVDSVSGESTNIQPSSNSNNNNQSTKEYSSEEINQSSSWTNQSNNSGIRHNNSESLARDANFLGNVDRTRITYRPPSEIGPATTSLPTTTTRFVYDSNLPASNNSYQANSDVSPVNYQSHDMQNPIIYQSQHNHDGTTRPSGHLLTKPQYANNTASNKDEFGRSPFYAQRNSTVLIDESKDNSNNIYNSQQNYQQSTIKLTSIKTFEGSTDVAPAIKSTSYDYSESNSISRQSTNWWAIGTPYGLNLASKLTKENYVNFCQTTNLLSTTKQRSLCEINHKIMQIIAKGLKTAIEECQYQFNSSRWNCSIVDDGSELHIQTNPISLRSLKLDKRLSESPDSIETNNTLKPIFGTVMFQQNRERSFLSAIMSAGIAYSITKACSRGDLLDECGCDQRLKHKNNNGKWEWGGCSEDIDYGIKFSRDFTDSTEHELDATSMINVHNYEVGRRVLKSNVDLTCKCHGVSGSCVVRTCWKRLGSFRDIGDEIIARYERATHVQLTNQSRSSRSKLRPVKRGARKPNKKDLVFIDESPDYCTEDKRLGILGTKNRECNSTSDGLDGCKFLCCGRGYQNIIEDREEDCECKFVWCCEVKCQKCKHRKEYDSCN